MGRFYGSIEEANKEARRRVEGFRTAAAWIPVIIKVFREYDSKVFNCRFDKALEAATGNKVHAQKTDYNVLRVYGWIEGYSYDVELSRQDGKKAAEAGEKIRINAEELTTAARAKYAELLTRAAEIENTMERVPQIKEYIKEQKEKLVAFFRGYNTDIRDLYGLPYYVRLD